ncbi:ankyrin repeat protein [Colletotrichum truncatum]|uniref:Ankyrin repeat protein n=1 Tax=Colletotrichum truncatum TaxID=5467 RepID=A0ACC3YDE8_COLTU|nr:ankyrin repeat protein [Colletotrichum truncatum]KAF6783070.1 ankyrin repeat protein [Colletotrichum truncatum]
MLVGFHVNPSPTDKLGRTPLFFASTEGHTTVVNILINRDPSASDWTDHYGSTPLSLAARRGHTEVVRLLLATKSVNIESRDFFGRTPLFWAKICGHTETLQLLIESGKQRDILLLGDQMDLDVSTTRHVPSERCCDICTFSVSEDSYYYNCSVCIGGDFDICFDCFKHGGCCLNESHTLVQKGEKRHN